MAFPSDELKSFGEQWAVIGSFCRWSREWTTPGGSLVSETPPESFYNLAVVLALSLLDEVLGSLAKQGAYAVRSGAMLGEKMRKSQAGVPWLDFDAVERAKGRRNDLAHQGKLIPKNDCLRIVDAIGAELRAWGAIQT